MILEGKRILVTGVVNRRSIAFAIAERAQAEGAEVLLTSFGRVKRMTERSAARLARAARRARARRQRRRRPRRAARASCESRWGRVDGAVHAIAFAPADALGGEFLATPREPAPRPPSRPAPTRSRRWPRSVAPLMERGRRRSSASTSTPPSPGPPTTGWASPRRRWSRSAATSPATSARSGVRVNLVAAGPVRTAAASGVPGFAELEAAWGEQAPLGWDVDDPTPVADAALFLLSDLSRATTGEIVHVDGGVHAIGAATPAA